ADAGPDRRDDAAGLMTGDDRLGRCRQTADRLAAFRPAVLVQVAAAHARRLHLDDDFALARRRVGEFHHFELAFAGKHNPAHRFLLPADTTFPAMLPPHFPPPLAGKGSAGASDPTPLTSRLVRC